MSWVKLIGFLGLFNFADSSSVAQARFAQLLATDPTNGYDFVTNPNTDANFIIQTVVGWVAIELAWIALNLVFWDYSNTQPSEEISLERQIEFFTDPEEAWNNIYITWTFVSQTTNICISYIISQ